MSLPGDRERLSALSRQLPGVEVRLRRLRRSLLSVRRGSDRLILTLHPSVIYDPDCSVLIGAWVAHRGRHGTSQRLRAWLDDIRQRNLSADMEMHRIRLRGMETIGVDSDVQARAARIHAAAFADLDLPLLRWSRNPPRRRLRHLRFGCYRRSPQPVIEISPRLARPWVAACFFDHVLHHELCHHRQHRCGAPRSEGIHSKRFRAWERGFPGHDEALFWERMALAWLLDDSEPPWYRDAPCTAPPASSPPSP